MEPKLFILVTILSLVFFQNVSSECRFERGTKFEKGYKCELQAAKLAFQTDGNFVIYDKRGKGTWSAKSFGKGETAVFQEDGNFVISDANGKVLYASETYGKGVTMVFRETGNLVILDAEGNSIWHTWSLSNFGFP